MRLSDVDLMKPVNLTRARISLPKVISAPDLDDVVDDDDEDEEAEDVSTATKKKAKREAIRKSQLQTLEFMLASPVYPVMVDHVRTGMEPKVLGAPYKSDPASIVVGLIATGLWMSERGACVELRDPYHWNRLCDFLRRTYPRAPGLWANPNLVMQTWLLQYVTDKLEEQNLLAEITDEVNAWVLEVREQLAVDVAFAYVNPGPINVVYGDGVYLLAATDYQPGDETLPDGRVVVRRGDPTARAVNSKTFKSDRQRAPTDSETRPPLNVLYVLISWRVPHTNERVLLDAVPVPEGSNEAEVWTQWLIDHRADLPGVTVALYDGAMRGTHGQRLIAKGYIPMNKVPGTKTKLDTSNLGPHRFKTRDGIQSHAVYTLHGAAGIAVASAEGQWWVPLTLKTIEHRATTIYLVFEVPESGLVPSSLRGASVRVRLNSTNEDFARGINRAEHLRAFHQHHPVFKALYGIRSDAESHNHKVKKMLPGKRLRTTRPARHRFDFSMWQLKEAAVALEARDARLRREARDRPKLLLTG